MQNAANDGKAIPARSRPNVTLVLGALILFIDGFDLAIYGVVLPKVEVWEPWNMTPELAGLVGSLAPLGMIPGAILSGILADRHGQRIVTIVSLVWVTFAMLMAATAPDLSMFMTARLLTGIGVGALTPLALSLVSSQAPPERHTLFIACAMAGLPIGGTFANLLGSKLLPSLPFQIIFLFGLTALLLIPAVWLLTSDMRGVRQQADKGLEQHRPDTSIMFRPPMLATTIGIGIANIMALTLFYGASVWLPAILVRIGRFDLESALHLGAIFFVGALAGQLLIAWLADRLSPKPVILTSFLITMTSAGLLFIPQPTPVAALLLAILGMGTAGAGMLLNAFVAAWYPPSIKTSALGVLTGTGRFGAIVGPAYIGLAIGLWGSTAGIIALMVPALAAAFLVRLIPGGEASHG